MLTHYAAFAKAKELGYGSCKEIITGNNFLAALLKLLLPPVM